MPLKFQNRALLYSKLRSWLGPLSPKEVTAINFLLDSMEADRYLTHISWAAYMMATIQHETAGTFRPIHEYGGISYFVRRYGGHTRKGKELGNDTPEEGSIYAGQGYVQLTGESNYERAEAALNAQYPSVVADFERRTGKRFDLTVGDQPNDQDDSKNVQDPHIAYAIISYGMRTGMFTTKKLSDYTTPGGGLDALNARKIINGTDKDDLIAGYYRRWLDILIAGTKAVAPKPEPELELEIPSENPPTPVEEAPVPQQEAPPAPGPDLGANGTPIKVAIEKPEKQGFLSGLWKRITVLLGGNVGLETVTSHAQQAGALGLTPETWTKIGYLALIASAIFIIAYAWDYWNDHKRNKQITQDLTEANSTPENTVQLIEPDMADLYRSRGYKVITR